MRAATVAPDGGRGPRPTHARRKNSFSLLLQTRPKYQDEGCEIDRSEEQFPSRVKGEKPGKIVHSRRDYGR